MSVVYRMGDSRQLKIDSITVTIQPLDYKVKSDMQSLIMDGRAMDAAILGIKNGIKEIKGLVLPDGSEYELGRDEKGILDDDTVNDLLNIPESAKINLVAIRLLDGMPQREFIDPQTGETLEGVSFVKEKTPRKKPQRSK